VISLINEIHFLTSSNYFANFPVLEINRRIPVNLRRESQFNLIYPASLPQTKRAKDRQWRYVPSALTAIHFITPMPGAYPQVFLAQQY
jgi:hypothetical protein